MKFLVTGAAGFIGSAVSEYLLKRGDTVVGVDNLNDYYDVSLKHARLERIAHANFSFRKLDVADGAGIAKLFANEQFEGVVHLAAQAGVRYSIENPKTYFKNNLEVFFNILEASKKNNIKHLIFASTSSVYGENNNFPLKEKDNTDKPISFYAATKKSNEVLAHSYSYIHNLPCTALRFFTVYGPWDRPDMALQKFTKSILSGKKIQVFNYGKHRRDFTYIDDIVKGVIHVLDEPAKANENWNSNLPDPATSNAPWRIYNIGNNSSIELMEYIQAIENALRIKANKELLPLQPGDVLDTFADVTDLVKDFKYKPSVKIDQGVAKFIEWYKEYYGI